MNWSASLAPPFHVRRAWAEEHGLPYFATTAFADHIDAVTTRMGVSTTAIVHSKASQLFLKGFRKLGIHTDSIPQNTAGRTHDCGMCQRGCRFFVLNFFSPPDNLSNSLHFMYTRRPDYSPQNNELAEISSDYQQVRSEKSKVQQKPGSKIAQRLVASLCRTHGWSGYYSRKSAIRSR